MHSFIKLHALLAAHLLAVHYTTGLIIFIFLPQRHEQKCRALFQKNISMIRATAPLQMRSKLLKQTSRSAESGKCSHEAGFRHWELSQQAASTAGQPSS